MCPDSCVWYGFFFKSHFLRWRWAEVGVRRERLTSFEHSPSPSSVSLGRYVAVLPAVRPVRVCATTHQLSLKQWKSVIHLPSVKQEVPSSREDAAIHNSCPVLLKASRHEKRGKWKGYASLDGSLSAREEMEPLLPGRLFIRGVIYIYPLFTWIPWIF